MRINSVYSFFAASLCGAALLMGAGAFGASSTFEATTDQDNNGYNGTVKAGGDGYAFTAVDSARYYKFLYLYDDLLLDGAVCAGSTNWFTANIGTYAWHPVTVTVTNGARMVTRRNANILFRGKGGQSSSRSQRRGTLTGKIPSARKSQPSSATLTPT